MIQKPYFIFLALLLSDGMLAESLVNLRHDILRPSSDLLSVNHDSNLKHLESPVRFLGSDHETNHDDLVQSRDDYPELKEIYTNRNGCTPVWQSELKKQSIHTYAKIRDCALLANCGSQPALDKRDNFASCVGKLNSQLTGMDMFVVTNALQNNCLNWIGIRYAIIISDHLKKKNECGNEPEYNNNAGTRCLLGRFRTQEKMDKIFGFDQFNPAVGVKLG